jgi:hypothetical protein
VSNAVNPYAAPAAPAPDYQDVIAATPHVKYRTSIVVWIFLALVIGLVVIAVLGAFPGR